MWGLIILVCCIACSSAYDAKEFRQALLADEDFVAAKDACLKDLEMKPEDLHQFFRKHEDVSLDFLCFLKCVQERRNYVDFEHKLIMDQFSNLPFFSFVSDEEKEKILDCLGKLGKIEKCQDMKQEMKCFQDALE